LIVSGLAAGVTDGTAFVAMSGGDGAALIPERGAWKGRVAESSDLIVSRFEETRLLAPRQLDTWKMSIVPFSGIEGMSAVSKLGAMFVGDGIVQIQAGLPMLQHKLVLLAESGQTLEAPVQIYPEKRLDMEIPEGVSAVALLDQAKSPALKWERGLDWRSVEAGSRLDRADPIGGSDVGNDLDIATFDIGTRHVAHALLGLSALPGQDFDEADYRFEQSLLYNGEDHLTWWMKAMTARLRGSVDEDRSELLNAHYLAPLEPALRAESFLSQPRAMEKEPSALLKVLADYPEAFIEVAALLVEARLYEQAVRWIDDALRHAHLAMLRYLSAYCHISATTMDIEAAEQVSRAARLPLGPPYPWRPIEIEAIEALKSRFPKDERLKILGALGLEC
jgi:hypothetical protein